MSLAPQTGMLSSPLGSLAAPQGKKPSAILLPQLQGNLVAAIHFPVSSSHPQLSKRILQLPDLGTVVVAESGHGPLCCPSTEALRLPPPCPTLPQHPRSPLGDCHQLTFPFSPCRSLARLCREDTWPRRSARMLAMLSWSRRMWFKGTRCR